MHEQAPRRCGAMTRDGDPCKNWAMRPSKRCRMHGGKSLKGIASPHYKHGLYSVYSPIAVLVRAQEAAVARGRARAEVDARGARSQGGGAGGMAEDGSVDRRGVSAVLRRECRSGELSDDEDDSLFARPCSLAPRGNGGILSAWVIQNDTNTCDILRHSRPGERMQKAGICGHLLAPAGVPDQDPIERASAQ
jgi:hypothetical protein